MNVKRPFQFRMPDGTIETQVDTDYLQQLGMTDEFMEKRQQQKEAHLISETHHERKWRDAEMRLTDKLMYKDSTYNGQLVEGTHQESDILDYRKALREYDLKYMDRPVRPEWFHG